MEFKGVLNRSIVLSEDKVSINFKGMLDKLTSMPSVEFTYEQIKSIEIFDSKTGMLTLTAPSITFKVDGQEFKGRDSQNPYKVFFVGTDEGRKQTKIIKDEIYKRIEEKKNQDGKGSSSQADELKKFADLKEQGIITEEEFNAKKKQILGL